MLVNIKHGYLASQQALLPFVRLQSAAIAGTELKHYYWLMTQQEYLNKALTFFGGKKVRMAEALGVSPPFIYQITRPKGHKYWRPLPVGLARRLERETDGLVTRAEMFPEMYGE